MKKAVSDWFFITLSDQDLRFVPSPHKGDEVSMCDEKPVRWSLMMHKMISNSDVRDSSFNEKLPLAVALLLIMLNPAPETTVELVEIRNPYYAFEETYYRRVVCEEKTDLFCSSFSVILQWWWLEVNDYLSLSAKTTVHCSRHSVALLMDESIVQWDDHARTNHPPFEGLDLLSCLECISYVYYGVPCFSTFLWSAAVVSLSFPYQMVSSWAPRRHHPLGVLVKKTLELSISY